MAKAKWGKVLGIALVVMGVLLAAGWALVPTAIERMAPERVRAAAAARGFEVRWGTLKWVRRRRALELRDVTIRHRRGEVVVSLLRVGVDLEFRPRRVEAVGVIGALDLAGAKARTGLPSGGGGGVWVTVRDAQLDLRRGKRNLAHLQVEVAKLRGAGLERARVVVEPRDPRLPRYMKVKVFEHEGAWHVQPDGADHLLDVEAPGVGRVRVEQARVWADGRVEGESVELRRGPLRVEAWTVGRDQAGWTVRNARVHHGEDLLAKIEEGRYADGTAWIVAELLGGSLEAAVSLDGSLWLTGRDLDLAHLPLPPRVRVGGRADVDLSAALLDDDVLAHASVRVAGVEVASKAIAEAPLTGIAASFEGDLSWREGRFDLADATFRFGPTLTRLSAWVDDADPFTTETCAS